MPEEDWELIPHKVLADLKDEVHILKEKLNQPSTRKDVVKSNDELRKSIQQMQKVFETALSRVDKDEDNDVMKRLSDIEKQNEQIAKALVTIADMVEGKSPAQIPRPAPLPMSTPSMSPMSSSPAIPPPPRLTRPILPPKKFPPSPPRRMPRADMLGSDLPPPPPMGLPPPPPLPGKKGLLGKLFKT